MKWAQREEWRDRLDAIIADHLEPAFEEFDLEPDELPDLLGQGAYAQLIGCAFEDFVTCDFEPDGRNVIDDYLKRRGWKEPAPVRHYLEALRRSVMSVYEVVGTTPGSHFMARDLIRGGEPMRVKDKLASQSLAQWDRLAARMLPIGSEVHMAGGVVPLDFEDSRALLEEIAQARKKLQPQRQAAGQAGGRPDRETSISLRWRTPFSARWRRCSPRRGSPGACAASWVSRCPTWSTSTVRSWCSRRRGFRSQDPRRSGEIESRLDGLPDLVRDEAGAAGLDMADRRTAERHCAGRLIRNAVMFKTYDEHGGRVLGSVRLDPAAVVLQTNSVERAERGRKLAGRGARLAGEGSADRDADARAGDGGARGRGRRSPPPEPPLPPEEMAALMHEVLDRHYREILSQPIPMLDGKSPKQAARSKAGRRKVAEWLKYLENGAARRSQAQGHPAYDFGWMWEALKVTDLRH